MVSDGHLIPLTRFTYENPHYQGEVSDLALLPVYIEKGVLSLFSAAVFHGLSDSRPSMYEVAIPQKAKTRSLPEWPPIKVFYFSDARWKLGVETIEINGGYLNVYDAEKTICDLLRYRNKTSLEDVLNVLKTYLQREQRDIPKLISYAKQLHCYTLLKQYLEVLL
jgi:predicted transcriptional regulator of viral defense system